jgi:DNA-binding transcriptional MerR regulator
MERTALHIGELARRAGVSPDTLRYYERLGLLAPPPRTNGGFRQYGAGVLERVAFIKKAQTLGLTLEEVREVLRVAAHGTPPCAHVRRTLERRLEEIGERIAELESLRATLKRALARTRALPVARSCVCEIIESADVPKEETPWPPRSTSTRSARPARPAQRSRSTTTERSVSEKSRTS